MEVFKIKPGGFNEIKGKLLLRTVPIVIIGASCGLLIPYFTSNDKQDFINVYPYVIPLLFGILLFGLSRGFKTQRKIFESYTLTIDRESITREQHNTPDISIAFSEIKEILKNSNGSFTIKGNSLLNVIGIPSQIEDYDNLEKRLNEIKPITLKTNKSFWVRYGIILVPVLTVGLFLGFVIPSNKIIFSVCGFSILAILGYAFYTVQTSKNVNYKTKRRSWWSIWVAICIAGGLYLRLSGYAGSNKQGIIDTNNTSMGDDTIAHFAVQQKPKFLDGDLSEYLGNKIVYPEKEREKGITGTVYINFIVEKDGSVTHVKVLKGIPNGSALDSEAVQVISSMPNWTPGMQNGRAVRVSYNIPIHFELR